MIRETKQREAILLALQGQMSHPTADEIYDEVRKHLPRISKGTVYRNLAVLRDVGMIVALNLNGTVTRYEVKKNKHYHFRCERCGRVIDLEEPVNEKLDSHVARRSGLKINGHQLEFRGLCPECEHKGGGE